jgi:hypothetical protein
MFEPPRSAESATASGTRPSRTRGEGTRRVPLTGTSELPEGTSVIRALWAAPTECPAKPLPPS